MTGATRCQVPPKKPEKIPTPQPLPNVSNEPDHPQLPHANHLATQVVDAAYQIHRALGPGLLESVYEVTLAQELQQLRNIPIKRQHPVKIRYRGLHFDEGYRADLLVDDTLLVEIKCVETVLAIHRIQLLSYLRLANLPLGLLVNFKVPIIKHGLHRVINKYEPPKT
jgi:iron complex transport system substrate-binding protein